ncbi:hypothetical protein PHJA_000028600 [Phtheirospermum japonicum]|uniref:Uncharacterized protein n=1 Tax=Phtheirospermum japonicum TaxID=374723 RepID=A0A830BA16_9LAMI|nr:hypothetical protein PHJA_000028600 [Phtheirospermum japonicum]
MVLGWRKAFCTSIPKDQERDSTISIKDKSETSPSPKLTSRFTDFFSTPRLQTPPPTLRCRTAPPSYSAPQSPKLQCKTRDSPKFFHRSNPTSPRSPSTFSLLKSSLRLSKSRCGICLERVKTGQGTAIFTAECGHSFHFPCIGGHVTKQGPLTCPICSSTWKDMHLLPSDHEQKPNHGRNRGALKVYNDDEPLLSPTSGARFNPIPESDETTEEENDEFPGFFASVPSEMMRMRSVEIAVLPEAAVVSVGKSSETYAVVLKIKAPAAPTGRAPIDLVTVLNVSRSVTAEKLNLMKKAMRLIVSSLSAADRLSIVAFSTTSKRLLPLRRMTTAGRRSARRIIDAIVALDGGATSAADSLKKAAKVIEDRRENNPTASVILFSDGHRGGPPLTSASFPDSDIPFHTVSLSACLNAPDDDTFAKSVVGLLSVVVQDLKFQLGFMSGSASAEISAVYSRNGKPAFLGSGSSLCRVGDLHSKEEREFLIELKVPSLGGSQKRQLSIRCSYKDPSTQQPICDKERPLPIPRPRAVGSSTRDVQRLRCLFVTTRALAESRRLAESNDEAGARHMLASARALILHTGSDVELVQRLEAALAELTWKRKAQLARRREAVLQVEEKAEPLTPASAWRAAERLAKVAIMRKSLNRVSDLHGFENAGF